MSGQGADAATAASHEGREEQASILPNPASTPNFGSGAQTGMQSSGGSHPTHESVLPPFDSNQSIRDHSTSPSNSRSPRRRRREGKAPEGSNFSMERAGSSDSKVPSSHETSPRRGEGLGESNDPESFDVRRTRPKSGKLPEDGNMGSARQPSTKPEGSATRAGPFQEGEISRSTENRFNGEGSYRSAATIDQPSGSTSQAPIIGAAEALESRQDAVSGSEHAFGSSMVPPPAPPKDDKDLNRARNRGKSNASSRSSRVLNTNMAFGTPRQDGGSREDSYEGVGSVDAPASASIRTRASSNSSSHNEDSSSFRRHTPIFPQTPPSQSRHPPPRPEVILPRWQPDAEVTLCPICRTQFSFFVRKHHCRKCGRVVCSSCSPHRITIPYQFIVQPPTDNPPSGASSTTRPVTNSSNSGNPWDFAGLGGGERVRLCNPCVPDPNIAPPQTSPLDTSLRPSLSPSHNRSSSLAANSYISFPRTPGTTPHFQRQQRQSSLLGRWSTDSSIQGSSQSASLDANNGSNNQHLPLLEAAGSRIRSSTTSGSYGGAPRQIPEDERTSSSGNAPQHGRPAVPRDRRPLPMPPQGRIDDADLCPVCHRELPSSTLPGAEALREAHINECIEAALRGTTSPPIRPSNPSSQSTSATATPLSPSSAATPIPNTPEARAAAREQAHAAVVLGASSSSTMHRRRTGVFPYKATEKDCIDDAECTICFEEFEVGVDMGRLECFCRFHLRCIRKWFETRPGQCPVHQHDGGGF